MNDMARCGAALVVLVTVGGANALAEPQAFPSAEAAAQALRDALEAEDGEAFRAIFGPEYADDLIGSDIAILREEMRETREAMRAATALLPQADGRGHPDHRAPGVPVPGADRARRRKLALRQCGGPGGDPRPADRRERARRDRDPARLRAGPARVCERRPRRRPGPGIRAARDQYPRREGRPLLGVGARRAGQPVRPVHCRDQRAARRQGASAIPIVATTTASSRGRPSMPPAAPTTT